MGAARNRLLRSKTAARQYWHTMRHLQPVQIYGRLWFHLYRPPPDCSLAPPLRAAGGTWRRPAARAPSLKAPDRFVLLNREGHVRCASDWNVPGQDRLWLYNLHYFDDLNASATESHEEWHRRLIDRWVVENAPGQGPGWEPYPLSLRIVNWIKWALVGNRLEDSWRHSLAVQARFLQSRLEWHLLGNHLFANAKALIFAGVFFDGQEADGWREFGLRILAREVPEQILEDGGHFELSPMYHAIVQEDLIDLINVGRAFPGVLPDAAIASWTDVVARMRAWLAAMTHPDGEIAFFNDAAQGVAPKPSELEAYAERLGLGPAATPRDGVTHLPRSGYIRVQRGDLVALLDVGKVGPDYLPGHAHADTLSFELSLSGQRVIVNSGTSTYQAGPERHRQRSTAAHNSVVVDGENSSEVWDSFRVARRARPLDLEIDAPERGEIAIACAHDGYRRLPGRVTHRREWRFGDEGFAVEDRLDGRYASAVAYLHLHPNIEVIPERSILALAGGRRLEYQVEGGDIVAETYPYHPEFGLSLDAHCLRIDMTRPRCGVKFRRRGEN